jgi:hypothetical protein
MERAEPGDSHPIINEWGGGWAAPWTGEGGPWAKTRLIRDVLLFYESWTFPNFQPGLRVLPIIQEKTDIWVEFHLNSVE